MTHGNSHIDTFTRDSIDTDRIEQGIRNGRRLRAQAFRGAFGKVRAQFGR